MSAEDISDEELLRLVTEAEQDELLHQRESERLDSDADAQRSIDDIRDNRETREPVLAACIRALFIRPNRAELERDYARRERDDPKTPRGAAFQALSEVPFPTSVLAVSTLPRAVGKADVAMDSVPTTRVQTVAALRSVAETRDATHPRDICVPVVVAREVGMLLDCMDRLAATLAQPHIVWAAGQHSVGVDIVAEDARLRADVVRLTSELATLRDVADILDDEFQRHVAGYGYNVARIHRMVGRLRLNEPIKPERMTFEDGHAAECHNDRVLRLTKERDEARRERDDAHAELERMLREHTELRGR